MNDITQTPAAIETDKVVLECAQGIATITLNRPDAGNALDYDMIQGLAGVIHGACDDPSTRVVVIRAKGKAFCVGGDINAFQTHQDQLPEFIDSLLTPLNRAMVRLLSSGLPIVNVVSGPVGGGGIGLALCGDYVIAAESMKLRGGYSAIGLTPDVGSSWFLTHRAGAAKAKQVLLLNEPLSAQQCLDWGLVDAVYPDTELEKQCQQLISRLHAGPKPVFARIKSLVDTAQERSFAEHLELERQYMVASGGETNVQEGVEAFLAKRAPRFE